VEFCCKTFNMIPIFSEREFDQISFNNSFDLIWVGSLFTHIDLENWEKCLTLLVSALNPKGLLVFTTAGRFVSELINLGALGGLHQEDASEALRNFSKTGFGYARYPGLPFNFGRTLIQPFKVFSILSKYANLRVIGFVERGWAGRQDVYSCIKTS